LTKTTSREWNKAPVHKFARAGVVHRSPAPPPATSLGETNRAKLSVRTARAELSYLQLIEFAVVSAFRKAGVPLSDIYDAREYVRVELKSEYPFAEYRFKSDGRHILMDYDQLTQRRERKIY
jgi:hypothetical protein